MSRAKGRPERTPVGKRNILTVKDPDPRFKYRVVNDVDDRIPMFDDAGYTAETEPMQMGDPRAGDASQLGSTVRKPVGGGISAVLMKIPIELYEQDQAAKEKRMAEKERSLLQEANGDGFYGEGLKITRPKVQID